MGNWSLCTVEGSAEAWREHSDLCGRRIRSDGSASLCLHPGWSSEFTFTLSGNTIQFDSQSNENKTPGNNVTEKASVKFELMKLQTAEGD